MADEVWTVEQGSYSDYKVMCVTRTKAEAEHIVDLYNDSDDSRYEKAYVGRLPLIVGEPERITTYGIQETVWDDGQTSDHREDMRTEWEIDMLWPQYNTPVTWRWVRAPMHGGKGGRLEVNGTDQERVRRVFSDRRAQLLADDVFRKRREAHG